MGAPDALSGEDSDGASTDPIGGAYADVPARTLWVWDHSTLNPAYLERVEQAWAGWQVEEHADGLAQQMTLSGRDPARVTAPRDQLIAKLLNEVSGTDDFDARALVWRTMTPTERETATFAPGFFRLDRPATTADERREALLRLLQQVPGEQAHEGAAQ